MKALLENLAGIMNAAKDNEYGVIVFAALVTVVVIVLLLGKSPLWARFVAIFLVFVACALPGALVFNVLGGVEPGSNGSSCSRDSDCNSGACYPGPYPELSSSKHNYCLAAGLNCSLPGFDGARYGTTIVKDATELICSDPGRGKRAKFYRK